MTLRSLLSFCLIAPCFYPGVAPAAEPKGEKTLKVLFVGNSYTARHRLANVVKSLAESGNPQLVFEPTTVIYGGRTLADHWRLGTANYLQLESLTAADEKQTIAKLEEMVRADPKDRYAKAALKRHRALLPDLESQRTRWDVVVLQSYRDDLGSGPWRYAEFAPKFAELAHAQGARVILYETTPTTQNAKPLSSPPDGKLERLKASKLARLADQVQADAAPMSLVGLRCQTQRPDLTLRFVNDAHLNQTMAYLTACTIYSALFDRSPEGLPLREVTDIRFFQNEDRTRDRDGKPITKKFSEEDTADLQRIAWEAYQEFQGLRGK